MRDPSSEHIGSARPRRGSELPSNDQQSRRRGSSDEPLRILIVDESALDAELAVAILAEAGYRSVWTRVQTRDEFLGQFASNDFDLVLANHNLPAFDGMSALELMRERGVEIPFILISCTIGEEAALESVRAGAAGYVVRTRLNRLAQVVERALSDREVTLQRTRAQEAVATNERTFRALIDNALDMISILGPDGTIRFASPSHERVLGYGVEELLGANAFDLVHPDDLASVRARFTEAIERPQAVTLTEFRIQHIGGSWRVLEGAARNLIDDPTIGGVIVNTRDITDRKRIEETLVASEGCFRSLVERSSDAILLIGCDGSVIYASPAAERIFGQSVGQLVGRHAFHRIHVEDLELGRKLFANVLAERDANINALFRHQHTDGSWRWIEAVAQNLLAEPGIKAIVVHCRDSTERRRVEESRRDEARITAALARVGQELISSLAAPELLERLCRVSSEVLECDSSSTLYRQSEGGGYVPIAGHGLAANESNIAWQVKIPSDLMAGLLARLEKDDVVEVGSLPPGALPELEQSGVGTARQLCMALRRGDEIAGIQLAYRRVITRSFSPVERRIAQGIAQLASMALEDARLMHELEAASRVNSQFVANVSHELRTPLNIIVGYTDLLLEGAFGTLTGEQGDALQRVDRSTRLLTGLVDEILDLNPVDEEHSPLDLSDVDVGELLTELSVEMQGLQSKPGVSYDWRVDPDLPKLCADARRLKVALRNLIGNALKFTDCGSIHVDAHVLRGGIEIAVVDTGIGIAAEALPIIFEPFRQVDASDTRRYGGVGLGLYIARRLLDVQGGTISVTSSPGEGSTFLVWLPASATTAPPLARATHG
jgi:PAS domain S-box-containing protein